MAIGHWHHQGQPDKCRIIGLAGAYHGDTTGAMSVGYSELFHRAFSRMVFPVDWFPAPDALRPPEGYKGPAPSDAPQGIWPSEWQPLTEVLSAHCLSTLDAMLSAQAPQTAAVCIEPIMQGAAGMICQPPGFLKGVETLCRKHNVLLIADEVAVGFGRVGDLFACTTEEVAPDLLCLAKGITGGYLPLAATLCSDAIEQSFCGELHEKKTFFHGHTYTGNPLACVAALAGLELFDTPIGGSVNLVEHTRQSARLITEKLNPLRACPNVLDIRQRGLMVGIELGRRNPDGRAEPFDFTRRTGYAICDALREEGVLIRPLGDILVLMPAPAMDHNTLTRLVEAVVSKIVQWHF